MILDGLITQKDGAEYAYNLDGSGFYGHTSDFGEGEDCKGSVNQKASGVEAQIQVLFMFSSSF